MLVRQQGNRLWTLLDLEDGFHQMPLSGKSRQYTAFYTPWGVFEWKVLPMGIKVGPQAWCQTAPNTYSLELCPTLMIYSLAHGLFMYLMARCWTMRPSQRPDFIRLLH